MRSYDSCLSLVSLRENQGEVLQGTDEGSVWTQQPPGGELSRATEGEPVAWWTADMLFLVMEAAGQGSLTENFRRDQRCCINVYWVQRAWSSFTQLTVQVRLFLTLKLFSGSPAQTLGGHKITQRLRIGQRRRQEAKTSHHKLPVEGDPSYGKGEGWQINQEHGFDLYRGCDILMKEVSLCSLPQLAMDGRTEGSKEGKVPMRHFWYQLCLVVSENHSQL